MKAVDEKVRAGVHELVDAVLDARAKGVEIHVDLYGEFMSACLFENVAIVDRVEFVRLVPSKFFDTAIKRVKGWAENA